MAAAAAAEFVAPVSLWQARPRSGRRRPNGSHSRSRGGSSAAWPASSHAQASVSGPLTSGQSGSTSEPVDAAFTPLDRFFLSRFRLAIAHEVGRDSPLAGYAGLVESARALLASSKRRYNVEEKTRRVLQSLFPPLLLPLFRALISPLGGGVPAAVLTARVTKWSCEWLMGPCKLTPVTLPDNNRVIDNAGVLVEKCRYLEQTGCAGICVHTCKMPTQAFMMRDMGVPLLMEPNYEDFSCQFSFGVAPPTRENDPALATSCLAVCPTAAKLNTIPRQCPQVE
eukprot:jgi/Chlat1/7399/Chrsp6S07431